MKLQSPEPHNSLIVKTMHLFQYLSQWKKENGSPPKQTTKNGAIKQAEGEILLWHLKKEEKKQEVLPEMIKK